MHIEETREYCLQKKGVTEGFPFDDNALVFKVMDKMFALLSLNVQNMNLKCDPEKAIELRAMYNFVMPGYHMSKKHWNTITSIEQVPTDLLMEWIDNSYNLVVAGLPKKKRELLL